MSIIRAKRTQNFTIINNKVYERHVLSWQAMGMLGYLLSKPDDWRVVVPELVNVTKDTKKQTGREGVYNILKELEEKGYLTRKKNKDGTVDSFIFDEPKTVGLESAQTNQAQPNEAQPNQAQPDVLIRTERQQELNNKNNTFVDDEKNGKADEIETKMGYEEKPDAGPDSFVAAEAATQSPKVGNLKTKSARPTAENKKRFERIVDVYNRVFADCPMVSCVALTKVPNPKGGALEYTKVNQERLKLIPYAWEFAKLRLDGWKDDSGLIDGEQPSSKHVLMWFETYFTECLADGFINGSQPRSKAHENWKADFNYMMKRETLEKRVLEK